MNDEIQNRLTGDRKRPENNDDALPVVKLVHVILARMEAATGITADELLNVANGQIENASLEKIYDCWYSLGLYQYVYMVESNTARAGQAASEVQMCLTCGGRNVDHFHGDGPTFCNDCGGR